MYSDWAIYSDIGDQGLDAGCLTLPRPCQWILPWTGLGTRLPTSKSVLYLASFMPGTQPASLCLCPTSQETLAILLISQKS